MMNQPESSQVSALLQETLQEGGQAMLTVTSNSMSPLIRRGDQVILVALTRPLQPGDIITFQTDAGLWTHRFWGYVPEANPPLLLTRGDKPEVFDPPTPAAHMLGLVIQRQRHGRWLHLYHGRGYWLNRHLVWLAAWENRVLTGKTAPKLTVGSPPARWRQGIHWVLHWWGRLVTAVFVG